MGLNTKNLSQYEKEKKSCDSQFGVRQSFEHQVTLDYILFLNK